MCKEHTGLLAAESCTASWGFLLPAKSGSADCSSAVSVVWKEAAAFPSLAKPLAIILPYKETKASETLILWGALQLAFDTFSIPRVSILPPPKHLVFLGPLPKIRFPLPSSSLCFSKPLMLINNMALLNLRARSLQKERSYSNSSPNIRKALHLAERIKSSVKTGMRLYLLWSFCLLSVLPKTLVSLLLCGEVHIFTKISVRTFLYKHSDPSIVSLHPSFLPSSPIIRRKTNKSRGNQWNHNQPSFYKRKPKEQIVSAHAQYPVESLASVHMVRRGGTINPTITRNYFFCYKILFHLSSTLAETHSANQNSEGPGKPPRGKNLDQMRMGDVCSLQLEG